MPQTSSFKNETIKEVSKQLTSRISVSADKLDTLNHLVSELVTTNSELSLAIQTNQLNKIAQAGEKIEKLSKLFRENALDIRLVPVRDMLVRFKRLVRDLSMHLGKKIDFKVKLNNLYQIDLPELNDSFAQGVGKFKDFAELHDQLKDNLGSIEVKLDRPHLDRLEEVSRVEGWLYEGKSKTGVDPWELLRSFIDRTDRVKRDETV